MRRKIVFLATLILISPAFSQQPKDVKTSKGKPIGLVNLVSVKPDCSAGSVGIPAVIEQPQHGSIVMSITVLDVKASGSCPDRRLGAIVLVYVPNPDFAGSDTVTIEVPDTNKKTSVSYRVSVLDAGEKL